MDKSLAQRLKAYIEIHPFDSGDSDYETVLDQLYQAYINFYNNGRFQKRLRCMTPMEFHYAYAA